MGQVRPLGSPFQINYPKPDALLTLEATTIPTSNGTAVPYAAKPLSCSDTGIDARCACPDCPEVCAVLPHESSPAERAAHRCTVGRLSCWSFSLILVYAVLLVTAVLALGAQELSQRNGKLAEGEDAERGGAWGRLKSRWSVGSWTGTGTASESGYDRLPMEDPIFSADEHAPERAPGSSSSNSLAPGRSSSTGRRSGHSVGAESSHGSTAHPGSRSSAHYSDSPNPSTGSRPLGAGASLIDPEHDAANSPFNQPRAYALNDYLANAFYQLGLWCAYRPYLTLALGLAVCGVINAGWSAFAIEKDPVRLWVAKGSKTEQAKNAFDEAFGPFYRTEQVFVSVAPPATRRAQAEAEAVDGSDMTVAANPTWRAVDEPVLTWKVLQWWESVEQSIVNLRSSPNGYSLKDVCFSPQTDPLPPSDTTGCVIQTPLAYFGGSLAGVTEASWAATLNACASSPASCLAPSGQPINPKLVLGGIPGVDAGGPLRANEARALVVTYVVRNSLDEAEVARAEEWERSLQGLLEGLVGAKGKARVELGLEIAYSTGVSLEGELSGATNTDVPIVVLSYLVSEGSLRTRARSRVEN